jgi:hypothetical protein
MSNHPFSTLPAVALSPPDRAEEHELELCEFCGEWIEPGWGCRCSVIDAKIDDLREALTWSQAP